MHDYVVCNKDRDTMIYVMAIGSAVVAPILTKLFITFVPPTGLSSWLPVGWKYTLPTGVLFAILYFCYDRWGWKIINYLRIPNLNGKWTGFVETSKPEFAGQQFPVVLVISQNFSQIEITLTADKSKSESITAVITPKGNYPELSYSFINVPDNNAGPGQNTHHGQCTLSLFTKDTLRGNYFSGRDRLAYGTITLTKEAKK